MASSKIGLITRVEGDMFDMIVFPRANGQSIESMQLRELDSQEYMGEGEQIELYQWYSLKYNQKQKLTAIILLSAYPKLKLVSDEDNKLTFEFDFNGSSKEKFGSSAYSVLALNVPSQVGPLLLGDVGDGFSENSGNFQLLEGLAANNDNVVKRGICWVYVTVRKELEEKFETGLKLADQANCDHNEEEQIELADIIARVLERKDVLDVLRETDKDLYKRLVDLRDDYTESREEC